MVCMLNGSTLSSDQLRRALSIKEQIESLESELAVILGGTSVFQTSISTPQRGRPTGSGMSAAGRARIAAAQRARWAKKRGESSETNGASSATASPQRGRRRMSAAAKARIAAAARARWAAYRARAKG